MPTAIVTGRLAARLGTALSSSAARCSMRPAAWFLLVPSERPDYLHHWLPGLVMSGIAVGLVLPSLSGAAVARRPTTQWAAR